MRIHLSSTWESFRVAIASLRSNKLRTALTLVGIVVGVAAVIAVVTIIKGLDQTVASTFSSQGSTVFTVAKRPLIITSREDFIKTNRRRDVTADDAFAKQLGVPVLLANVTQQVYQMARAAGFNKEDGSAVIKVFERLAGVRVGGGE